MEGEAPSPTRVLVANDHPVAREGMRSVLACEPDLLEVVGEAKDGQEALEMCRKLCPDLILMDLSMLRMDGLEATRKIKELCPKTGVLIVTAYESDEYLLEAIRSVVVGYLLKRATTWQLLGAMRSVLDGGFPFDQDPAMRLLRRLVEKPLEWKAADLTSFPKPSEEQAERSLLGSLTPREVEVLRLMSGGQTNHQIAKNLFISVSTVKKHVRQVLAKLRVSDRTQAALRAFEMGLSPKQEE